MIFIEPESGSDERSHAIYSRKANLPQSRAIGWNICAPASGIIIAPQSAMTRVSLSWGVAYWRRWRPDGRKSLTHGFAVSSRGLRIS